MGKSSREKGKRFELQVAHWLQDYGFKDAMRSAQHSGKAGDAADVVGMPGIHLECKAQEQQDIWSWMRQAIRDSKGTNNMPVVIWKQNRKPWVAIMLWRDYLKMEYRDLAQDRLIKADKISIHKRLETIESIVTFDSDKRAVIHLKTSLGDELAIMYADDFMWIYQGGDLDGNV